MFQVKTASLNKFVFDLLPVTCSNIITHTNADLCCDPKTPNGSTYTCAHTLTQTAFCDHTSIIKLNAVRGLP